MKNIMKLRPVKNTTYIVLLFIILFSLSGCSMVGALIGDPDDGKISRIVKNFSEHNSEAVVTFGDERELYVIDTDGNVKYVISEPDVPAKLDLASCAKYNNGYVLISYSENRDGEAPYVNYVRDLNDGVIKIEEDSATKFTGITESGYVLQRAVTDTLGGLVYESKIVDIEGNVVWQNEDSKTIEYFQPLVKDLVIYCEASYENYYLINVRTGDIIDLGFNCDADHFEYDISGRYFWANSGNNYTDIIIDMEDFRVVSTSVDGVYKVLNDKYVYARPNHREAGIYNLNEELIKDLSEGGVKYITYMDGLYYVISDTEFFYTMNDQLEYVQEPVKMHESYSYADGDEIEIGENITIFRGDFFPTSQFDPTQEMPSSSGFLICSSDNVGFVARYGSTTSYELYNLETLEEIVIER